MRIRAPEIAPGPRADILRCVQDVPGAHLRGIERMTGLPLGQVLYHLDRLERMGIVNSVRDQGFRRYYRSGVISREEKPVLAALHHDVPRQVVLALLAQPGGLNHKALLQRLPVAASTLSFHLSRLMDAGVLERERRGASNLYRLRAPDLTRRILLQHAGSFMGGDVARFAAERGHAAGREEQESGPLPG